jgi:N-acetylmuramic acid 6-phosphate etherase
LTRARQKGGGEARWAHLPTEQSLAEAGDLERRSTSDVLALILAEEGRVHQAALDVRADLARAVDAIVACLSAGGRLIYVGAGTSGRLAALDAAELPPTFGIARDRVLALVAGAFD